MGSLSEEALCIFENKTQTQNVAWRLQQLFRMNPALWHHLGWETKSYHPTSLDCFFRRADRMESLKEPELVPQHQAWGSSHSVTCCWWPFCSTISHILSLFQLFFSVHLMPAPVCQLLYFTTVLLKVCTVRFKSFISCLLFMYYLCGKYI